MLPTVAAMAEHYQVGRGTNNRALRPLADDGLLVIRERWGRSALSHADPAPPVPHARLSEPPCGLGGGDRAGPYHSASSSWWRPTW